MKSFFTSLSVFIVVLSMVLSSSPTYAEDKPLTRAEVESIVKKTLQDNPEVIVKSLEAYQARQQAATMAKAAQNIIALQGDLKNNPNSPSIGNPNADVAVIEFFDYHCGYCKHFFPVISKLLEDDKNVNVVFKEFPILSEDSVLAAKAALAVNSIDKTKYFAFHSELMKAAGRYTMEILTEKAKEAGIDADTFKKAMSNPDIEKELSHNKELAQSLNIGGTPAIIIGKELLPGAVELDTIKAKIAAAREAEKKEKK